MNKLFQNWRDYLLKEGGNAFKSPEGKLETVSIRKEDVHPTLQHFFENHLIPSGVEEYLPIGSTGKKSLSGDLDIVIDTEGRDKKEILSLLGASLGVANVKLVGQNIAVKYPIIGSSGEFVQIDLMLSSNAHNAAWLMSGTGDDKVKGIFRNLLLNYVAYLRAKQGDGRTKVSISYPGGLQKKVLPPEFDPSDPKSRRKWKPVGEKITDPQEILNILGLKIKKNQVENFDDLVSHLITEPTIAPHLEGFEKYIENIRYDEAEKQKAVEHLRAAIQNK